MKPILSPEQYAIERAICDRAQDYAESIMSGGAGRRVRNYLTAEEAKHPDYAACNNDMRGRVEQFEILTELPDRIGAYIGRPPSEERYRSNYAVAWRYPVTVWTGLQIGWARISSSWRIDSHASSHMYQYTATIGGREYTGRGMGEGMFVSLRLTAAARRKLAA